MSEGDFLARRNKVRRVRPPKPAGSAKPGHVRLDDGQMYAWRAVAEEVRKASLFVDNHLADVVLAARAEGHSWDRISAFLGGIPTGHTLCRVFGEEARRRGAA